MLSAKRRTAPTSWLTTIQAGVLTIASPDAGLTSLSVSAPAPAGKEKTLRPEINSLLVQRLKPARVQAQLRGPIGKIPAITTAIQGTDRGQKIVVLSTAISSPYRTYSIQVFFRAPHPSRQSRLEVTNMLASMRFVVPAG